MGGLRLACGWFGAAGIAACIAACMPLVCEGVCWRVLVGEGVRGRLRVCEGRR